MSFSRCDWLFPPSAREVSPGTRSNYKSTRERVYSKGLYGRWRLHLIGSWKNTTVTSVPYAITLIDHSSVYVNKDISLEWRLNCYTMHSNSRSLWCKGRYVTRSNAHESVGKMLRSYCFLYHYRYGYRYRSTNWVLTVFVLWLSSTFCKIKTNVNLNNSLISL